MSITTASLVEQMQAYRLLDKSQFKQLAASDLPDDPRQLARDCVRRGWLTTWQVNRLFTGKGEDLLLGSYVLLEKLGEGGMGAVFKAHNRKLGRLVALKLIRKERLTSTQAAERFLREIRAAAILDHPHIVRALDAEQTERGLCLVMAYVEGTDLHHLVEEHGPLPIAEAVAYVRQTAVGLQHAFEKGLVHRDIKPSNLLLANGSLVKILDFGLAHQEETAGGPTTTLTHEGQMLGTPDFVAPEQIMDASSVDIRADLYSLGCTFYFLLAGEVPFPRATLMHKLDAHRFEEPAPLAGCRPGLLQAVERIVRRLMAKRPNDRFATPAALVAALDCLAEPARASPPASAETFAFPPQRPTLLPTPGRRWILGVLAGVLGTLALLWLFWPPPPEQSVQPGEEELTEAEQTLRSIRKGMADPRADRWALRDDALRLWHEHPGTTQALEASGLLARLPSPLNRFEVADIPAIERFDDQPPGLVAVLGQQTGRHEFYCRSVAVSPDGRLVATTVSGGPVLLWDARTMRWRETLPCAPTSVTVAFSDKRLYAALGAEVMVWDISGSKAKEERKIAPSSGGIAAMALSAEGKHLITSDGVSTLSHWKLTGPDAEPMPQPSVVVREHKPVALALSADGRWLALSTLHNAIVLLDLAEAGAKPVVLRAGGRHLRAFCLRCASLPTANSWPPAAAPRTVSASGT
jgi:serine/threonine-protein kinase